MKKKLLAGLATGLFLAGMVGIANATLVSVGGDNSSMGFGASIITAPVDINDDAAWNQAMQGFDEKQNVTLSSIISFDGGTFAAGTVVNSHMIFLNSGPGNVGTSLSHFNVNWNFANDILGVMSNGNGSFEINSTPQLGNAGTTYPLGTFSARGIEGNNSSSGPWPNDGYSINGNILTVGMSVTEPGDWIRVVTAANPVPEPTTMLLFGTGLIGLAGVARRKKK